MPHHGDDICPSMNPKSTRLRSEAVIDIGDFDADAFAYPTLSIRATATVAKSLILKEEKPTDFCYFPSFPIVLSL